MEKHDLDGRIVADASPEEALACLRWYCETERVPVTEDRDGRLTLDLRKPTVILRRGGYAVSGTVTAHPAAEGQHADIRYHLDMSPWRRGFLGSLLIPPGAIVYFVGIEWMRGFPETANVVCPLIAAGIAFLFLVPASLSTRRTVGIRFAKFLKKAFDSQHISYEEVAEPR